MVFLMTYDQWMSASITLVGLTMACGPIPQIMRVHKRKSSEDVSVITYMIFGCGNVAWFAYGWHIGDWPIIITNSVAAVTAGLTVGVSMKYR